MDEKKLSTKIGESAFLFTFNIICTGILFKAFLDNGKFYIFLLALLALSFTLMSLTEFAVKTSIYISSRYK